MSRVAQRSGLFGHQTLDQVKCSAHDFGDRLGIAGYDPAKQPQPKRGGKRRGKERKTTQ